jgi:cytochrome oxidase Cu insertion factor (SCO1/SenC/PrrC family)
MMRLNRPQITLLIIAMLFVTPLLVAMLMNSQWWGFQPASTTNLGQLVDPPRVLDETLLEVGGPAENAAFSTRGKWTILYPVRLPCEAGCLTDVQDLRQIHRASGRHRESLAVMLLIPRGGTLSAAQELLQTYAEYHLARDASGAVTELLAGIGDLAQDGSPAAGQAFLVDPGGNIMMRYAPGFDPNHINKDLKRLLKWSKQDG